MSELASLAEGASSSEARGSNCPICGFEAVNVKKLKTHLLLKHPELNLCLFCVDKKGWSDTFASQKSYNQHYKDCHEGVIEKKEQEKAEDRLWKKRERERVNEIAEKMGRPPPKRLRKRLLCTLCKPRIEFDLSDYYERHLIVEHKFEYCVVCSIIGPSSLIRAHILDCHSDKNKLKGGKMCCYICCGSGPVFGEELRLTNHLVNNHSFKTQTSEGEQAVLEYHCYNCEQRLKFPTKMGLLEHLKYKHEPPEGQKLRIMKKKKRSSRIYEKSASDNDNNTVTESDPDPTAQDLSVLPDLRPVQAICNTSGRDCFSISILHMLAQTDFAIELTPKADHENCKAASCIMAKFLNTYYHVGFGSGSNKSMLLDPVTLVSNYSSFGLDDQDVNEIDCGDFLRSCLFKIGQTSVGHLGKDLQHLSHVSLEWKFECPNCQRYMVMKLKDYVIRISPMAEISLEQMIKDFLNKKTCQACKHVCDVSAGLNHLGIYIFIEVDRSLKSGFEEDQGDGSKELSLFSLQLKPSYTLFGFRFAVLGTVNYKLDNDDGGHYVTYLFPSNSELLKIHEIEHKTIRRKPDFDSDTVVIALQKIDMSSNDLSQIEVTFDTPT